MVYKNSVRRQILNFISSKHGNFLQYCNLKYEVLSLSIVFKGGFQCQKSSGSAYRREVSGSWGASPPNPLRPSSG